MQLSLLQRLLFPTLIWKYFADVPDGLCGSECKNGGQRWTRQEIKELCIAFIDPNLSIIMY